MNWADNASDVLLGRVRDRIATARLDTDREPDRIRQLVTKVVHAYQREATTGLSGLPLRDVDDMVQRLVESVLELGPLEQFFVFPPPAIEVWGCGDFLTWTDEYGRTFSKAISETELRHAAERLLERVGRQLTDAQPIISVQIEYNGIRARLTATTDQISDKFEVRLRFYRPRTEELSDLVTLDMLTQPAANFLGVTMRHPQTGVALVGPPMSGKTSAANALMREIPNSHRVSCVEDTRELNAPLMQISYWRTKPRSGLADEDAEISLRTLVAYALRNSPMRIVVGEVRGDEAVELTRAGDAGAAMLVTFHAHTARDALDTLSNMALRGDSNLSPDAVHAVFARRIDVIVALESEDVELRGDANGRRIRRQVMEIAAVPPLQVADNRVSVVPIFERADIGAPLLRTRHPLPEELAYKLNRVLRRYGTTIQAVLDGHELDQQ